MDVTCSHLAGMLGELPVPHRVLWLFLWSLWAVAPCFDSLCFHQFAKMKTKKGREQERESWRESGSWPTTWLRPVKMTKLLKMTKVPHVDLLTQRSKSEFHNLFPVFKRKTCKQTLHVCPEQYETEPQPVTGPSGASTTLCSFSNSQP